MSQLKTDEITIRGVKYTVSEMSFKTRKAWLGKIKEGDSLGSVSLLAHACTVDPSFASQEAAEGEAPEVIDGLAAKALQVSGIRTGDAAAAGNAETAEKKG